ncbi:hypothetical protein [Streptomyces jumonjinensis]|uniref:Uncharacterized protein n=1 Tax=Streptomyces jumonjinensis TaxID=1945 RepID=A0A646KIH1_STRJU|nr:hypothetical protein [Streptomyces jumonjinensis]MQT01858.1 hypothetical protein [Streptomyces jumonjinensis]
MTDSTTAEQATVNSRGPAPITVPPLAPAAADARDKLLAAIGAEAQHVAEHFPGQASAQLAELARAYALLRTGFYQPVDFVWQPSLFQPVGGMDAV